jgi:ribonuclease P protein subunit RPR2
MAKGKAGGGVQNRAIYSRMSFLQQAAVALSSIGQRTADSSSADASNTPSVSNQPTSKINRSDSSSVTSLDGMSRRLATDLRAVSLKTRIRLKPAVKQTICKFCDSILIDGESCTSTIENKSRGAKKPWADVLVRRCDTCGRERRYPVSAARARRKTERGLDGGGGHLQNQNHKG